MTQQTATTPIPRTGAGVWDNTSFTNHSEWTLKIDQQALSELTAGVDQVSRSEKVTTQWKATDFSMPVLETKLNELQTTLLSGKGFSLIKGLPEDWSDNQLKIAYWIIGAYLGDAVSQNAQADLLGHVIDQRQENRKSTRIYQTNRAQPYHSDSCDIVGLLCLRVAKSGGASAIASSAAIHNELLKRNPDALKTLYGEFLCDRYQEIPPGKKAYYPVHIFNEVADQLICCGMDPDIRSAQRLPEVPDLSHQKLHALDAFQETAEMLSLKMNLARGDIQLANNHRIVHARTAFTDHADAARRRYLVRLWLSARQGPRLPEFLKERWGNIEPGSVRGGIRVAKTPRPQ